MLLFSQSLFLPIFFCIIFMLALIFICVNSVLNVCPGGLRRQHSSINCFSSVLPMKGMVFNCFQMNHYDLTFLKTVSSVCLSVCMCVSLSECVCFGVCVWVCVHVCVLLCMCVCMVLCVCVFECLCVSVYACAHALTCACVYGFVCVCVSICVCSSFHMCQIKTQTSLPSQGDSSRPTKG